MFDGLGSDLSAVQLGDRTAFDKHDDPVTQPDQLVGIGRRNDDRNACGGCFVDQAVDLVFRTDIDSLRRFVQYQKRWCCFKPATQCNFLLIASGQCCHG